MFLPPDRPSAGGPSPHPWTGLAARPRWIRDAWGRRPQHPPPGRLCSRPAFAPQCLTQHLPGKLSLTALQGLLLRKSALRRSLIVSLASSAQVPLWRPSRPQLFSS